MLPIDCIPLDLIVTLNEKETSTHVSYRILRIDAFVLYICLLINSCLRLRLIYDISPWKTFPCRMESFSLHVCYLFHIYLVVCLRLFVHYCLLFDRSWPKLSPGRILSILMVIYLCLCLLTLPSMSNEWTSIVYDEIRRICLVDYTFNYSYTFFIVMLTCFLPFVVMFLSHRMQIRTIKNRLVRYVSNNRSNEFHYEKKRFQCYSIVLLVCTCVHIVHLIGLHSAMGHVRIRHMIDSIQLVSSIIDAIVYLCLFHSLSILMRLKSFDDIYFI
jgi:hypothetical protein